jgi:hypothetical protein
MESSEKLTVAESSSKCDLECGFYMEVVDDVMAAVLRQKTPCQRLEIADRMWIGARDVLREVIVGKEPNLTASEIDRKVAQRLCGEAYPDAAK